MEKLQLMKKFTHRTQARQPTMLKVLLMAGLLLLFACQSQPIIPERADLIRSMIYTHRHLVTHQLNNAEPSWRYRLLVQSHCDLIKRDIVTAPKTQACLNTLATGNERCMAEFHTCISQCATFKQRCELCENQAQICVRKP